MFSYDDLYSELGSAYVEAGALRNRTNQIVLAARGADARSRGAPAGGDAVVEGARSELRRSRILKHLLKPAAAGAWTSADAAAWARGDDVGYRAPLPPQRTPRENAQRGGDVAAPSATGRPKPKASPAKASPTKAVAPKLHTASRADSRASWVLGGGAAAGSPTTAGAGGSKGADGGAGGTRRAPPSSRTRGTVSVSVHDSDSDRDGAPSPSTARRDAHSHRRGSQHSETRLFRTGGGYALAEDGDGEQRGVEPVSPPSEPRDSRDSRVSVAVKVTGSEQHAAAPAPPPPPPPPPQHVVVNQAPAPPTVVIQQPANHNGCSEATSALVGLQLLFWDAINRTLDRRQADMTEAVVCMQLMMQDTVGRAIEQTGAATSQAVRELGAHLAQSLGVAVRDASGAAAGAMGHLEREIVQAIDRSAATTAEAMSRLNLNVVLPPPVVLPEPPAPPRPPPPPEPVPPQVVFVERVVTPARAPPAAAPVPPSRPDVALYFPTPQRFVSDTAVQTRVTPASFSSSDESSLSASSLEGLLVPSTAKLMANAPPFPSDLSEGEVYVPPHFTDTDGAHSEGELITVGTQQLRMVARQDAVGADGEAREEGEMFQGAYWNVSVASAEVFSLEPGELHGREPGELRH